MKDKEKQIENMIGVMAASNNPFVDVPIEIMPQVAKALYNAGYRKGKTISYQAMIDHSYLDRINQLEKEIEKLTTQLEQANAGNVNCSGCKLVEINAVRAFAEKLKEKFKGHGTFFYDKTEDCHYYRSVGKEIDELLKEYEK